MRQQLEQQQSSLTGVVREIETTRERLMGQVSEVRTLALPAGETGRGRRLLSVTRLTCGVQGNMQHPLGCLYATHCVQHTGIVTYHACRANTRGLLPPSIAVQRTGDKCPI